MEVFIARQPILDRRQKTVAYELLYRESLVNSYCKSMDGSLASLRVICDTITTFGLYPLTNSLHAYINFTRELLLEEYAYAFSPNEIVIELLENMRYDGGLMRKIAKLRSEGYRFALDDYTGDPISEELLKHLDILKVDFRKCSYEKRVLIAQKYKNSHVKLLAEKVENLAEYNEAYEMGYDYFQGYYFAKPTVYSKNKLQFSFTSYMRVMKELRSSTPDFDKIARSIQVDVALTYKLLRTINSVYYYRGNQITSVKHAIVMLGLTEMQKWIMLIMLRDLSHNKPSELVKTTLVRAHMAEKLVAEMKAGKDKDEAYFVGMFSLIDAIVEDSLENIIDELPFTEDTKQGLLRNDPLYADLLSMIEAYEHANWELVAVIADKLALDEHVVSSIYPEALSYADQLIS